MPSGIVEVTDPVHLEHLKVMVAAPTFDKVLEVAETDMILRDEYDILSVHQTLHTLTQIGDLTLLHGMHVDVD